MIEIIPLEEMKINDLNDIQIVITRIIMKSNKFTQIDIFEKIKKFLISKGVKEEIIDSYKINRMIDDTIDFLVEREKLICFNNIYIKNDHYTIEENMTYGLENLTGLNKEECHLNEIEIAIEKMINLSQNYNKQLSERLIPKMRLYGISKIHKDIFFDTEYELIQFMKKYNLNSSNICVAEFIGDFAGRKDVIRMILKNGVQLLYTVVDEDGYGIYNYEKSISRGEFVWEYNYGNISEIYSAFRNRGIVFENDIYSKIEERNQHILKMCKKENLFNMGKKTEE